MPYKPFEFEEDGETKGFDFEVVRPWATCWASRPEFVTTPFDSIIAAVKAGNCDMIASAMTITEERAEQVDSSPSPTSDADQSLLVRAAVARDLRDLEDLAARPSVCRSRPPVPPTPRRTFPTAPS